MKALIFSIAGICLIVIQLISCKKIIDVEPPKNQLVTESVFLDSADAEAAVVGIYSRIMQYSSVVNFFNGGITVFAGVSGDELYTTSDDGEIQQFADNRLNALNNQNFGLWKFAYEIIYHANACLAGLQKSNSLAPSVRNRLLGEVKFVRSLALFNLVNLYGRVPLVLGIDHSENAILPRSDVQEIYRQIEIDLIDAEELMPIEYLGSGKIRPNRFTATALLARVYLFQQKWEEAEATVSKVINAGTYSLETDLSNVFLNGSSETIWQMPPLQTPLGTPEARQFIPLGSSIPIYPISPSLENAFEIGDQRRISWVSTRNDNSVDYLIPFKYKYRVSSNVDEYYIIFRLAELYLIRAEARIKQSKLSEGVEDMNRIRERAGLSAVIVADQLTMLEALYQERRIELFCEWGHRWYDIKRWGIANQLLQVFKPNWNETDALFPVPQSEIESNPFLVQNAGY